MKATLFSILLTCVTFTSQAQNNPLIIEIPRDNHSELEITTNQEKFTLTHSEDVLVNKGEHFEFDKGKGGAKDQNGFRERHKQYFKNSNNDTLAVIIDKENKIQIGNTFIEVQKMENGWKYLSDSGKEYFDLKLYWNKVNWKYELTSMQSDFISKTLEKVILLSLVEKAVDESKCDSSSDDSAFWSSLYFVSLISCQ